MSPSVRAQTEQAPTEQAPIEADEVVVTTGFRPKSLADSVGNTSVIAAGLIESREAQHLEAVVGTAANVTTTSGASRGRFVQIRGIGDLEQFVDPKHYPSVGLSIDGFDVGGIAGAAMLFDVEQIEVLRGPQGTTFGASALAGRVNVISAAPAETFDAYLDAGVGDYGTAMLGLAAGGGMSETVSGRVAVQHHRGDGYMKNAWLGRDDTNGYEETMLRAKLAWSASDSVTFDFTAIRFDSDNGYDAFSLDNTRTTLSDEPGRDDLGSSALGIKGTWTLATGGIVEAKLNRLESEVDYGFDEDWTYVGICDGAQCDPVLDFFSNTDRYVRERDDTSLDLRWLGESVSSAGRARRYVVGVYVQDRTEALLRQYYGPFASDYESDRLAIYGQAEIALSDRLELTLGLRRERFDDRYSDSFAFESESDDDLSAGEIALRYAFSATGNVFAVVSRGVKPGGVNAEASSVMPFVQPRFQAFLEPRLLIGRERLTSTELGLKNALAGGRLALRAAVFRMSRDDAQIESWFWDPVNFLWVGTLDNADGENLGAELDLDYRVSDRWRLRASLGLMNTEVDSLTTFDLDLDDFVVRNGIDQTKAPSWQAHVGGEWSPDANWTVAAGIDASDSHRYGYYHDARIGRSTIVNASLSRRLGATELTLWARNLLDEDVAVHGLYFGNDPRKGWVPERYLQFGEPRLVGLSVRHNF
ncbi:MAG TPA: TonB-dependent receptor [Gammaproteobacteria bacterium]|nr:TonB-dependent receptor [Gammaproteobacteria bacterium]